MQRLSVNLDERLLREIERERAELAERVGIRASLSAIAAGAIRRGLTRDCREEGDDERS